MALAICGRDVGFWSRLGHQLQARKTYAKKMLIPLLVSIALTASASAQQQSLGEVALQLRLQRDLRAFCSKKLDSKLCKKMSPEEMAKSIIKDSTPKEINKLMADIEKFTGDDHSWASGISQIGSPAMPTDPSQLEILNLSCEALGKAALQTAAPELDIPFPGRGEWERDLCRVRNEWHDQYLRYEAHKGTPTEIDEREKAADLWQILQGTALVGPAKARLYLDKRRAPR